MYQVESCPQFIIPLSNISLDITDSIAKQKSNSPFARHDLRFGLGLLTCSFGSKSQAPGLTELKWSREDHIPDFIAGAMKVVSDVSAIVDIMKAWRKCMHMPIWMDMSTHRGHVATRANERATCAGFPTSSRSGAKSPCNLA